MRHAAGQLPDRLHLLVLRQLQLKLLLFADVQKEGRGPAKRIASEIEVRDSGRAAGGFLRKTQLHRPGGMALKSLSRFADRRRIEQPRKGDARCGGPVGQGHKGRIDVRHLRREGVVSGQEAGAERRGGGERVESGGCRWTRRADGQGRSRGRRLAQGFLLGAQQRPSVPDPRRLQQHP